MEKKLHSSLIYDGRILRLKKDSVVLDNGEQTTREIIEHSGSVAMLPIDNENNFYLIKQYRYAVSRYLLEIPAGTIEEGERAEDCANRELIEEIGMKANRIEYMITFYSSPGFLNEKIHIYFCYDLVEDNSLKRDKDENIEIVKFKENELFDLIKSGEIVDGKTILAFLLWKNMNIVNNEQ